MRILLNSKFYAGLGIAELADKVGGLGYDGVDLCVRPGHPVRPDNVGETLGKAVRRLEQAGLDCPSVAAPVGMNDPADSAAAALFAAAGENGVSFVKVGYWYFAEGDDFDARLETARRGVAGFAALGRRYGVRACCHTHSGPCLGSNAAGMRLLLQEEPDVGAYLDFGHLALDGEDPALAMAMLAPRLCLVGIKDGRHEARSGSEPAYAPAFCRLGQGSVDWRRVLGLLNRAGYVGPLIVHTEYGFDESIIRQVGYADTAPADLDRQAGADAAFLRRLLSQTNGHGEEHAYEK